MAYTDYLSKFTSFEHDLINMKKVKELIYFIITEGLRPYTNFKKHDWKCGTFYYFKTKLFEVWCTSYSRGHMSFLCEYLAEEETHYVDKKSIKHIRKNIALFSYTVPELDENDKNYDKRGTDYYFKIICNKIKESLNKVRRVDYSTGDGFCILRHFDLRVIDNNYVHEIFTGGRLFNQVKEFSMEHIDCKKFSEMFEILDDLFYIKHYIDDKI